MENTVECKYWGIERTDGKQKPIYQEIIRDRGFEKEWEIRSTNLTVKLWDSEWRSNNERER